MTKNEEQVYKEAYAKAEKQGKAYSGYAVDVANAAVLEDRFSWLLNSPLIVRSVKASELDDDMKGRLKSKFARLMEVHNRCRAKLTDKFGLNRLQVDRLLSDGILPDGKYRGATLRAMEKVGVAFHYHPLLDDADEKAVYEIAQDDPVIRVAAAARTALKMAASIEELVGGQRG